jgi:hypothetical protein
MKYYQLHDAGTDLCFGPKENTNAKSQNKITEENNQLKQLLLI